MMAKFSKLKTNDLLKTILMFFFYFTYIKLTSLICQILGVNFDLTIALYADCIFILVIFFVYQDNIKKDLENIKKDYSWKRIIKTILIWVGIIILIKMLISQLISPIKNLPYDDNNQKIVDIYNISPFYTIFKTMIFGVVAEELLFRESVRDVVNNKWLFIIISSSIYTAMNYVYTDFTSTTLFIDIIILYFDCFLFSTTYIKNNSNIIILMLVKFVYNLIPLTILLLGL